MNFRIKELRLEKGLKQKDVAKILSITQQSYSDYERGISCPDYNALIKLAELYDCSTDFLLGKTPDEASLAFSSKDRALGVVENAPVALSDKDRELIHLFDEAERKLGVDYVQGIKQLVRITIDAKKT